MSAMPNRGIMNGFNVGDYNSRETDEGQRTEAEEEGKDEGVLRIQQV